MAEAYLKDKKRVIPCAALCEGEFGIDGFFIGVPTVIGSGGIEKIVELKPKKAYFTDICHDIEHNEVSIYLNQVSKQTNIKMKLAYDGLRINF